jgi:hypothetical protein
LGTFFIPKELHIKGLRATPALLAYRLTGPIINKKLNLPQNLLHTVIPVFSGVAVGFSLLFNSELRAMPRWF